MHGAAMRRLLTSSFAKALPHLFILILVGINNVYGAISASATQGTLPAEVRIYASGSTIQSVSGYTCTMTLIRNGANIQQVSCDSFNATGGYFSDTTVSGVTQYNYTAKLNNYRLEDHGSTVDQGWWVDQGSTVDQGWWVDQGSTVDQGWWVDQGSTVDQGWMEDQGYYTWYDPWLATGYEGDGYFVWVSNWVWHSNPVWVSNWVWHSNPVWVANWVWHSNPVWVSNMVWHSNPVWVANWGYYSYTENSNTVTGWAKDPIPPQVTGLTATKDTYYGKVALSWSAATYATQYDLYKSTASGTKGTLIASNLTGTSIDNTGLIDSTHFFYTVVAKNSYGSSPDSAQAEGWAKSPGTITTLTATQGTVYSQVQLNWSTIADATSYKIYRSSTPGGTGSLLATTTTNTYIDSTTANANTYYYKAVALVGTLVGSMSNEAAGWNKIPIPLQVTGLTASQGTLYGKSAVSWSPVTYATQYDLYRSTALGTKGALIGSNITGTSFDNTGLTDSTHYFYTVVAKNSSGSSPDSAQAEGWGKVPGVISTLTATQGTIDNAVQLNWGAVTDATSYKIYRSSTPGGAGSLLATTTTNAYVDSTTGYDVKYYYKAVALVGTLAGLASNEATGWGKLPIPLQVTDISATQGTFYGKSVVSWSPVTYASQYDLYRSTVPGTKGVLVVSDIAGTSFDNTGLTDDTHYFYTVVAKNKTGSSPDSAQAEGWGKALAAVNTLTATRGTVTNGIQLDWTPNPDATSYDIYRSGATTGQDPASDGTYVLIDNVSTNAYLDPQSGTAMFFYKLIAKTSTVSSVFGNETGGWANVPVTSASVEISTDWQTTSPSVAPDITDPNVLAGQVESFALAVTSQPGAGSVAVVSGAFVFTPPADGLFSGDQNFGFTVTDKGGAFVNATGVIHVACAAPTIHSSAVEEGSILPVSTFTGTAKFSLPTCGSNGQITIDVLNADGTVLLAGELAPVGNGTDIIKSTVTKGPLAAGNYLARFTVQNNLGAVTATRPLKVDPVIPPTMAISPAFTVVSGVDVVNATLSSPDDVNCPFVSDQAAAISDASKCFVQFDDIPPGMVADANQSLPSLAGIVTDDGDYPITAGVYRFDGTIPVKVASVTENITTTCDAPVITRLTAPDDKLPHIVPTYAFKYTANTCNDTLNTDVSIYKGADNQGDLIQKLPVSLTEYGANKNKDIDGSGLDEGEYTAEVTLTGSAGTAKKAVTFRVKKVPLPSIVVNPEIADQLETKVSVTLKPADDNYSCPLTADQSIAENDPTRCFVVLNSNVLGMNAGFSKNGLPMSAGYPAETGDYTLSAIVSRWVDGIRYDLPVPSATLTVKPTEPMLFTLKGNASVYLGIEASELEVKQTKGLACTLQTDLEKAKKLAATTGLKACFVEFTVPPEMSVVTNSINQAKASGIFTTEGERSISYTVSRVFPDETIWPLGEGQETITVKSLPAPLMSFQGGTKIAENKYYVEQGAPVTRMAIDGGIPTKAKLQITVTDKAGTTLRTNMMSGSSYWITTRALKLLEEQPITVRLAWSGFPSVYTERTLIAVGGTEGNLKLVAEAPLKASDTQDFNVKVKLGKYVKSSLVYTPETMGQWRTQIMMQSSTQATKVPITEMKDMTNGEAEFSINPAGYTYLKLTAVSELVSNVDGLDRPLSSVTRYVEIVKGSAIEGSISSKSLDGPAPKTFVLNLDMTAANRGAVKEVIWEESEDDGATWGVVKKSNTIRYNVIMENPGKRKVRVKMINKNTLIESYTDPVEVWSYAALDARIIGPNHMAPNFTATFAGELFRAGELTTDTVNEWTIVAPGGTTNSVGDTATITETQEGKIYITLKTRPADTREDDARAWTVAKYYLSVKTPTKPSVSTKGPRDVETGKTYHYDGIVRPSWGDAISVHTTKGEWQLPDGSIVEGTNLDWIPTVQDMVNTKPLIFRAWVDGFKEVTTSETMVNYVPWEYVWPNFTMSMKQLTVQAPSDIILMINHDRPDMNRRFEELTYEWSFQNNVTGRQNDAFPNKSYAQVLYAGEYDITVTIRDARGHVTVLTQHVVAEQAIPYAVSLKIGKSNFYERAPMAITVRPTITGGHPLDSVIGQTWRVDGVPVDEYANRDFMVSDIASAGDHVISYTLNSKMGETTTVNSPLSLQQNQLPVCELSSKETVYMAYVEAKCSDPDGKMIGYSWQVNGQPIGSTSYRISFNRTSTPQSATVTITGMDDAKELSTPVSINITY
jgi:fibronectin type 3 domain-containing protein